MRRERIRNLDGRTGFAVTHPRSGDWQYARPALETRAGGQACN